MPPNLALALCICFIFWLLRTEAKTRKVSAAIWLPVCWFIVVSSRPLSGWFSANRGYADTTSAYLEGNSLDRNVFFLLIIAGLWVVSRRGLNWRELLRENRGIVAIYLYFLLSTFWAEYPFVAFKRWVKDLGNVILALVVLTDKNSLDAIKGLYSRCAYILFPLSIVFILYFPQYGRIHYVGEAPQNTGVATQKNSLAIMVVFCGLIILWDVLSSRREAISDFFKRRWIAPALILTIGMWLLVKARSATAIVCVLFGVGLLLAMRLSFVRDHPQRFMFRFFGGGALLFLAEATFGVVEFAVGLLGRDMSFTGRTDVWELVMEQPINPVLGVGFSSFWSSRFGQAIWEQRLPIVSAHNGYLETYLNGGYIGVLFLALMLFSILKNIHGELRDGNLFGYVRFMLVFLAMLRNFSESNYFVGSATWFTFLMMAISVPGARYYDAGDSRNSELQNEPEELPAETSCSRC